MLKLIRRSRHVVEPDPSLRRATVFMERYDQLLGWALRLTKDKHKAEDVLHDTFIQFVLGSADPELENPDGYLRVMIRNIFVSQVRRSISSPIHDLPILDYDSVQHILRATDPRARLQARDELRAICRFACQRKSTSRTASVLILRFFHGYYPSEVAQIVHCTRNAVDKALRMAREEARAFLQNGMVDMKDHEEEHEATFADNQPAQDELGELKQIIFRSRTGECPSQAEL